MLYKIGIINILLQIDEMTELEKEQENKIYSDAIEFFDITSQKIMEIYKIN